MSTVMMQPGQRVADAAYPPSAKSLVEAGYVGLCGYVSTPTSNPKNWTRARIDECAGEGLVVVMFAEQSEATPLSGYSDANKRLGAQAEAMCNAFGYPDDCPVWFAVDTDARAYLDQLDGAFKCYRETGHRPIGVYAGSPVIDHLVVEGFADFGHMAAATSWSTLPKNPRYYVSEHAHMRQWPSIAFAGSRIDPNDVLLPYPAWKVDDEVTPPLPKPNPPTTEEAVLTIINLRDADAVLSGNMNAQGTLETVRWVTGALRDTLIGAGAQVIERSWSELGNMTLVGPLPTNDSRHTWTGGEFFATTVAPSGEVGPKGDKGDPGPKGDKGDPGPNVDNGGIPGKLVGRATMPVEITIETDAGT